MALAFCSCSPLSPLLNHLRTTSIRRLLASFRPTPPLRNIFSFARTILFHFSIGANAEFSLPPLLVVIFVVFPELFLCPESLPFLAHPSLTEIVFNLQANITMGSQHRESKRTYLFHRCSAPAYKLVFLFCRRIRILKILCEPIIQSSRRSRWFRTFLTSNSNLTVKLQWELLVKVASVAPSRCTLAKIISCENLWPCIRQLWLESSVKHREENVHSFMNL